MILYTNIYIKQNIFIIYFARFQRGSCHSTTWWIIHTSPPLQHSMIRYRGSCKAAGVFVIVSYILFCYRFDWIYGWMWRLNIDNVIVSVFILNSVRYVSGPIWFFIYSTVKAVVDARIIFHTGWYVNNKVAFFRQIRDGMNIGDALYTHQPCHLFQGKIICR